MANVLLPFVLFYFVLATVPPASSDASDEVVPPEDNSPEEHLRLLRRNFVRIGRAQRSIDEDVASADNSRVRRQGNFVRIGRAPRSSDSDNEAITSTGNSAEGHLRLRRQGNFVRIGRAPSSFVRIGRRDPETASNSMFESFEGDLLRAAREGVLMKNKPMLMRLGPNSNKKRVSSFVRIGKALGSDDSADEDELFQGEGDMEGHKRSPGFVRIGKSSSSLFDPIDKPAAHYLGIGEGAIKRNAKFVRIGRNNDKRFSSFLRPENSLSGSDSGDETEGLSGDGELFQNDGEIGPNKRSHGFVRIGKSGLPRYDPMDKSTGDAGSRFGNTNPIAVSRRGSAFVRIGKIPSGAFVPLTKDVGKMFGAPSGARRVGYSRRSRNGESSFVRIG